jgi:DNA-binding response OmpR family regulator
MHILIAEDDRNLGLVLKNELEEDGYTVILASDGLKAVLSFIDKQSIYDFVILDIKMPVLDGINVLRIIKKLNPEVPAITISGNAGSGEMAESIKAGAIRCLTKPFEIKTLKNEIKRYVSRRSGVNI